MTTESRHDARQPDISHALAAARWACGGSVGRTIYAVLDSIETEHARDRDSYLIGCFDTAELARAAVDAHNAVLRVEVPG
jgi:hypothetical protein